MIFTRFLTSIAFVVCTAVLSIQLRIQYAFANPPSGLVSLGTTELSMPTEVQSKEKSINEFLEYFHSSSRSLKRHVIFLPSISLEELPNYLLEIRFGKHTKVHPCGDARFENIFNIKKQGFTVKRHSVQVPYLAANFGDIKKSILFCSQEPELKFVEGIGEKFSLKSTHPVVVYAPKEAKVTYRLWKSGEDFYPAESYQERYLLKSVENTPYFQGDSKKAEKADKSKEGIRGLE